MIRGVQWIRILPITIFFIAMPCHAADWSVTELDFRYGSQLAPGFAGGGNADTRVMTLQHASGWGFGDVFLFVDSLQDNISDAYNDNDYYAEGYLNFSASKLTGSSVRLGAIKDAGFLLGINAARDAKVRKYLPGLRLSWDVPGFSFLNTDFMLYLDDSAGVAQGGAPKESDSWMVDVNWALPFELGSQSFSFQGHMEYVAERHNEFGDSVSSWVLAQPQLRWDAGKLIAGKPGHAYLGLAYQYWHNKLGDATTHESSPQLLAVWQF